MSLLPCAGANRYCLDKNYAGVLIIWDRSGILSVRSVHLYRAVLAWSFLVSIIPASRQSNLWPPVYCLPKTIYPVRGRLNPVCLRLYPVRWRLYPVRRRLFPRYPVGLSLQYILSFKIYLLYVEVYILSAEGYILSPEGYILSANGYILSAKGYIMSAKGSILSAKGYILSAKAISCPLMAISCPLKAISCPQKAISCRIKSGIILTCVMLKGQCHEIFDLYFVAQILYRLGRLTG